MEVLPNSPALMRFILFAHMRSGSTTFMRVLERHPALKILNEPFNKNFAQWRPGDRDYRQLVTDERSMDEQLEHIYRDHNGIKTLGYQIPWELSAHMLRDASRHVIFLKRMNILQTVVSGLISQQTGVWHTWDLDQPITDAYARLEPLSIDFIRGGVADVKEEIEYFEDVITSRTGPTLVVTHDDLYAGTVEQRRVNLARAFTFLGLDPPPADETDPIMDPANTRLNSERTYELLPNAREIDAALGNDETGRLFGSGV